MAHPTPKPPPLPAYAIPSWAVIGIFWMMAISALTVAQSLFVPLFTAIFLTLIFSPVRRRMERWGVKASYTAFAIVIAILLTLSGLLYFLAGTLTERIEQLPQALHAMIAKFETLTGALEPVADVSTQIDVLSDDPVSGAVVIRERGIFSSLASTMPVILGKIAFTLVLLVFLTASGDLFYQKAVQLTPTIRNKRRAANLVKAIEMRISSYFFVITLINAGLGLAVGLAMWALGMPDPVLFGLAAFLLNYIPFVGAIIGVAGTFAVSLILSDSFLAALLAPFVYFFLTAVEGQLVTPVAVGKRLRLNAVVVFLAVSIGAWMWSFMGMLLAIPILIAFEAFAEERAALTPMSEMLSEQTPVTDTESRILDRALGPQERKPAD